MVPENMNFSKTCRCCLSSSSASSINLKTLINAKMANIFQNLTTIEMSKNDNLPTFLCECCVKLLNDFNNFKMKCISSNEKLIKSLKHQKENRNFSADDLMKNNGQIDNNTSTETLNQSQTRKPSNDWQPTVLLSRLSNSNGEKSMYDYGPNSNAYEKIYKCRTCQLLFDSKKIVKAHCLEHHGQSIESQVNAKKHKNRKKFIFKIQVNTPPSMWEDPKPKTVKSPEKIPPPISKRSSNITKCKICTRTFKYRTSLINHLSTVHNSKVKVRTNQKKSNPFECNVCSKRFPDQRTLGLHKKTHKSGDRRKLECKTCWKVFRDLNLFKSHIQAHLKNFKCRVCGNQSNSKTSFYNHLRKHPEILNKCKVCGKLFKNEKNLEQHMTFHVVEDNPTETTENQFECEICLKTFKLKQSLIDHTNIHTGSKPYKCTVCLKDFQYKSSLKKHRITHTDDRPYKCDLCTKDYQYSSSLRKHKLWHEKNKQNIPMTAEHIVID